MNPLTPTGTRPTSFPGVNTNCPLVVFHRYGSPAADSSETLGRRIQAAPLLGERGLAQPLTLGFQGGGLVRVRMEAVRVSEPQAMTE